MARGLCRCAGARGKSMLRASCSPVNLAGVADGARAAVRRAQSLAAAARVRQRAERPAGRYADGAALLARRRSAASPPSSGPKLAFSAAHCICSSLEAGRARRARCRIRAWRRGGGLVGNAATRTGGSGTAACGAASAAGFAAARARRDGFGAVAASAALGLAGVRAAGCRRLPAVCAAGVVDGRLARGGRRNGGRDRRRRRRLGGCAAAALAA